MELERQRWDPERT
jgi:hypothetical protein